MRIHIVLLLAALVVSLTPVSAATCPASGVYVSPMP